MTDRELQAARRHLKRADAVLREVIEQVGNYQIRYRDDRFLALVEAIVAQQVSVGAARAILKRLLDQHPKGLTAERLMTTPPESLRAVGLSRQKTDYLIGLARHVEEGTFDLASIHGLDDEQVAKTLTQVKGIGRWTVEMFLIFCLRRPDVLPALDLGFRKAVQKAYRLRELPAPDKIEALAVPWQPYRSVATCYLWASLEPEPW
ncbi:MAG TPA: DNA-3-methyladenine glycosylase 2 family protein [Nitrospiria bacterium]|nr:DNA-3-methyladenine glycosylase 2 family protein [Nitrospiria bacterium]